jgi:hypothetical protein
VERSLKVPKIKASPLAGFDEKRVRGRVLLIVFAIGFVALLGIASLFERTTPAVAAQPWKDVRTFSCRDVISPNDGSLTPKTGAALTWLAGYRDGVASLAAVDRRLKNVGEIGLDPLGAMVLAYCKAKPEMPMVEAVTGVFEFSINAQAGERIDLALPHVP